MVDLEGEIDKQRTKNNECHSDTSTNVNCDVRKHDDVRANHDVAINDVEGNHDVAKEEYEAP